MGLFTSHVYREIKGFGCLISECNDFLEVIMKTPVTNNSR